MNNSLWELSLNNLYKELNSNEKGLISSEAKKRFLENKKNIIVHEKEKKVLTIFLSQFKNPLIVLLIFASVLAFFVGDKVEAVIIIVILLVNSIIGFLQEYRAERTYQLLKKYIVRTTQVLRDNKKIDIESTKIVPGDIVFFEMGDIIPADIRLINAKDLSINESVLTGESEPVYKKVINQETEKKTKPTNVEHIVFMGTSVASGEGYGIVISTGKQTYFGKITQYLEKEEEVTEFHKNMYEFGNLLIKVTIIISVFIFIVNVFLKKTVFESILFSLAIAVGITPELLPVIITITLAKGALFMARKKVIVKKLSSIEHLGNMNILCCDKTGTLTEGIFLLQNYLNYNEQVDEKVLLYSVLCSSIDIEQEKKKFNNLMDKAVWEKVDLENILDKYKNYKIVDKVDFDFKRRRISCLIQNSEGKILIAKGSPDSILSVCNSVFSENNIYPLDKKLSEEINKKINSYENDGYRVIALAIKKTNLDKIEIEDEKDLTFYGFLIFIDPPKLTAKASLQQIKNLSINVKIITGDSPLITKKICKELGVEIVENKIITGDMIDQLPTSDASKYYDKYNVFARITPEQKYNIVKKLIRKERDVGFLGDGINDAPALKVADVGISVNTAVDIARDEADIILLKKSLRVLSDGVIEGRKSFTNTMKYVLNIISSNFGNMTTVAILSMFLPFLPMLPSQILLTNLICDTTLIAISTDNVDPRFLLRPKRWNIKLITHFMLFFGLISSFFDLALMLPMRYILEIPQAQFRTAWFIFSCLTEIWIIFFIRTKSRFFQSRPSNTLSMSSIFMTFIIFILPFTTIGNKFFELSSLSISIIFFIIFILITYCLTIEFLKKYFFKKFEDEY